MAWFEEKYVARKSMIKQFGMTYFLIEKNPRAWTAWLNVHFINSRYRKLVFSGKESEILVQNAPSFVTP